MWVVWIVLKLLLNLIVEILERNLIKNSTTNNTLGKETQVVPNQSYDEF